MEHDTRLRKIKIVATCEIFMALGIISFWVSFFSTDMVNIADKQLKEIYLAFEHAFPIPDLWLSISLITGGIGLLRVKAFGLLFSLLGGASLIFLGLVDISFNVQQKIYQIGLSEAIMNGFINLLCLGFGIFLIIFVWKSKDILNHH